MVGKGTEGQRLCVGDLEWIKVFEDKRGHPIPSYG